MEENIIHLGYIPDKNLIENENEGFLIDYTCSKLGGKPIYFLKDFDIMPKCKKCSQNMVYIMQLYSPFEGNPKANERCVYVYFCFNKSCFKSNNEVRVFSIYCSGINSNQPETQKIELNSSKNQLLNQITFEEQIKGTELEETKNKGKKDETKIFIKENEVNIKNENNDNNDKKEIKSDSFNDKINNPSVDPDKKHEDLKEDLSINVKEENSISNKKKKKKNRKKLKNNNLITNIPERLIEIETEDSKITAKYSNYLSLFKNKENTTKRELSNHLQSKLDIEKSQSKDLEKYVAEKDQFDGEDEFVEEFAQMFVQKEDRFFKIFKKISDKSYPHIIRYGLHSNLPPLIINEKYVLSECPFCDNCKNPMKFEFQLMPYLYSYIEGLREVELSTVIVFTYFH